MCSSYLGTTHQFGPKAKAMKAGMQQFLWLVAMVVVMVHLTASLSAGSCWSFESLCSMS